MTEKIGLEATLKDQQFQAGLKAYLDGLSQMVDGGQQMIKASEGMVDATDDVGEGMEKTGKSAMELEAQMNLLQNAFDAVRSVAQQGLELAQVGAQAERVEQRFNALAAQAGGAEVILAAFQDGAGGAASEMEAMAASSKLLQMGLVTDADSMRRVVEMATRLGDQTQSVSNRIFDFALMLANSSVPRLDNFGISSGRVRTRIKELQDATEGLDRQTAFMQATLEIGADSLDILGERVEDNAMAFEKAQAKMADARVELGKKLAPAFAAAMNAVTGLHDTTIIFVGVASTLLGIIIKFGPAFKALAVGLKTSMLTLGALMVAIPALVAAFEMLLNVVDEINVAQEAATDAAHGMGEKMRGLVQQGTDLSQAMLVLSDKSNEMNRIWNSNIVTGTALGGIFGSHAKYLETAAAVTEEVNQTALRGSTSWMEYATAIDTYNANTGDATLKVQALNEAEYQRAKSTLPEVVAAAAAADQAMLNYVAAIDAGIVKSAEFEEQIQFTTGQLTAMDNEMASHDQAMLNVAQAYSDNTIITDEHQRAIINDYYALQQENEALAEAEAALERNQEATALAFQRAEELAQAHRDAAQAAFEQASSVLSLAESLSNLDAQQTARAAIDQLEELFNAGVISISEYDEQVRVIQDTFGLVSEEGRFLAEGLQLLKDAVADGRLATGDYNTVLSEMQKMAEEGDTDLDALKATMDEYKQPTEYAEGATQDFSETLEELDEPLATAWERAKDLSDTHRDLSSDTDDVTDSTGALTDADIILSEALEELQEKTAELPEPLDDTGESTDGLAESLRDAREPTQEFIGELETLPSVARDAAEGMEGAGAAIVHNLETGFNAAWPGFMANFNAKLEGVSSQLPRSRPKDPDSPLYHLFEQGQAIATQILKGFETGEVELTEAIQTWADRVKGLFDIGGAFGGLGGFAARMVGQDATELSKNIQDLDRQLLGIPSALGWEQQFDDVAQLQTAMEKWLKGYRLMLMLAATPEEQQALMAQKQLILDTLPLFDERNRLQADYADLNQQVTEYQERQQQLQFLQQQMRLLELINQYGLDARDVLGGLTMGLDADMNDVLVAMTSAMDAIIQQINDELEISSPSRVMQRIGRQMMQGMTLGISEAMGAPASLMAAPAMAMGGTVNNVDRSRSVTIQAGGNTIGSASDAAAFDERIRRIVRQEVRGY